MSPLVRITPISAESTDALCARLWDLGATGIAEIDEATGPILLVAFADPTDAGPGRNAPTVEALRREPLVHDLSESVDPEVWPTPEPTVVVVGDTELTIESALAFGHGRHPTTALALDALTRLVRPDLAVLDVGTGTGVLAMAARVLGARRVVGLDIDASARRTARRNATSNGVDIDIPDDDVADLEERFDLVVVNMLAAELAPIARPVADLVADDGRLFVTGLLDTQIPWVRSMFGDLVLVRSSHGDEGWVGLDFAHPTS